jgi:hypothetical protein
VCILPIFDTGTDPVPRADLAPLLEAYLAKDPWLEIIPSRKVYERLYEVEGDPWLVKGVWEDRRRPAEAESYTWLYERWLLKAKVRFPSDYYIVCEILSTGTRRNVVARLVSGTRPEQTVFTSLGDAATEEGIPAALEKTAAEIRGFLVQERSQSALREIRRRYLAQLLPLPAAVEEAEEALAARPESNELRILLLSFYAEDRSAYGDRLLKLAGEIARAWEGMEPGARQMSYELGIDPFLVLCEEQERRGDWHGVLDTARMGMQRHPLRSSEYERWASRAEERLQASGVWNQGSGTAPSPDR